MMSSQKHTRPAGKDSGFTLIELSIVLVIIGLIVGGILTGQDLIKSAEQRATIAQIEKYNTAVNTFRNKFGYIPGDIPWATANSFGLQPTAGALTAGGDGNGLLQDAQGTNGNTPVGEIMLFWQQLSAAGLIDGSYASTITAAGLMGATGTTANDLPLAKLGRGNYVTAGSSNGEGFNTFGLSGMGSPYTGGASGTANYGAGTNNLTPIEAYSMDKKVDDGMPNTGSVQARDATKITKAVSILEVLAAANASSGAAAATNGNCQYGNITLTTVTNNYNITSTGNNGTTPSCTLRFRFN